MARTIRSKKTPNRPRSARAPTSSRSRRTVGRPHFLSVAVVVADRRRAVTWYTERFGLDRIADHEHWQTVGRKGSAGVLHLCQVSEFDPKGQLEPGITGVAFTLAGDFVGACKAIEARGVEFATPPTKFDWGWGASVKDPDGNEIYLTPA